MTDVIDCGCPVLLRRVAVEPCWIEKQDKEEPRFARPRFEMVVGVRCVSWVGVKIVSRRSM